jgi:hypothetical protein
MRTKISSTDTCLQLKKITTVFLFQLLQFDYEVWEIIIYFATCFSFWYPTKNIDRSWTAKTVRYGRHWDESCNEWRLLLIIDFDGNYPKAKLCPYDDYKNMFTLNTYCGILSTCHNYKKIIIVDVTFVIDDWFSKVTSISRTQFVTWIFKKSYKKMFVTIHSFSFAD